MGMVNHKKEREPEGGTPRDQAYDNTHASRHLKTGCPSRLGDEHAASLKDRRIHQDEFKLEDIKYRNEDNYYTVVRVSHQALVQCLPSNNHICYQLQRVLDYLGGKAVCIASPAPSSAHSIMIRTIFNIIRVCWSTLSPSPLRQLWAE